MLVTFGEDGLGRLLASSSSMAAMWGDAARQVQLLLAAVLSAPALADLLRLACVHVRPQPAGAVLEHGLVRLYAVLLDEAGRARPLRLPPSATTSALSRVRVDRVELASDDSGNER